MPSLRQSLFLAVASALVGFAAFAAPTIKTINAKPNLREVTVPAGETIVIKDFTKYSYSSSVTITNGEIFVLNKGSKIQIATDCANTDSAYGFRFHVRVAAGKGNAAYIELPVALPNNNVFWFSGCVYSLDGSHLEFSGVKPANIRLGWGRDKGAQGISRQVSAFGSRDGGPIDAWYGLGAFVLPDNISVEFYNWVGLFEIWPNVNKYTMSAANRPNIWLLGTNMVNEANQAKLWDWYNPDKRELVVTNFNLVQSTSKALANDIRIRLSKNAYYRPLRYRCVPSTTQGPYGMTASIPDDAMMNPLTFEGGIYHGFSPHPYGGNVDGVGKVTSTGWGDKISFTNPCVFRASVDVALSQRGCRVQFKGVDTDKGTLGAITAGESAVPGQYGGDKYDMVNLYAYILAGLDANPLDPEYKPSSLSYAKFTANQPSTPTNGCALFVYGNQTVSVGTTASRGLHLMGMSPIPGTIVIDKVTNGADPWYVSTNVNLVVSNLTPTAKFTIYYDQCGDVNKRSGHNDCSLRIFNNFLGTGRDCTVHAISPRMMPKHVQGLKSMKLQFGSMRQGAMDMSTRQPAYRGKRISEPKWTFRFDGALDDPNIDGCEGSGELCFENVTYTYKTKDDNTTAVDHSSYLDDPARGIHIEIDDSKRKIPPGIYPLITCDKGGDMLEDWPITWKNQRINMRVLKSSTGLRLQVLQGWSMIIR